MRTSDSDMERKREREKERDAARRTLRQKKDKNVNLKEHRYYQGKTLYREVKQYKRGSHLRTSHFVKKK